jgi:hypothetical protein
MATAVMADDELYIVQELQDKISFSYPVDFI